MKTNRKNWIKLLEPETESFTHALRYFTLLGQSWFGQYIFWKWCTIETLFCIRLCCYLNALFCYRHRARHLFRSSHLSPEILENVHETCKQVMRYITLYAYKGSSRKQKMVLEFFGVLQKDIFFNSASERQCFWLQGYQLYVCPVVGSFCRVSTLKHCKLCRTVKAHLWRYSTQISSLSLEFSETVFESSLANKTFIPCRNGANTKRDRTLTKCRKYISKFQQIHLLN